MSRVKDQKSIHQLMVNFDSIFMGLWHLAEVDVCNFTTRQAQEFNVDSMFKLLIEPITFADMLHMVQWYVGTHVTVENMSMPSSVTLKGIVRPQTVLTAIKAPMIRNKKFLIKRLQKHYVEQTDNKITTK